VPKSDAAASPVWSLPPGTSLPADLAGDLYDFVPLDEHRNRLSSGGCFRKGVSARLVMAAAAQRAAVPPRMGIPILQW